MHQSMHLQAAHFRTGVASVQTCNTQQIILAQHKDAVILILSLRASEHDGQLDTVLVDNCNATLNVR